jgi:hypothetical protein
MVLHVKTLHKHKIKDKKDAKTMYGVVRKAKHINRIYDNIVDPMCLYEITNNHFPQVIPYHSIVLMTYKQVCRGSNTLYDVYNSVSTLKDVAESLISLLRTSLRPQRTNKSQVMLVLKTYIISYKLAWFILEMHGVHKDNDIVATIDYINFILSHF